MSDVAVLEKGLPPGLLLPRAEEPVEKFSKDVFNRSDHPYEEVIELGMFAVALAAFDPERLASGTLMPSHMDMRDIFQAGYGIGPTRIQKRYDGYARLQQALGFCPREYRPEEDELVERLDWFANKYLPVDDDFKGSRNAIEDVLEWGMRRRLLPSLAIMQEVLGKNHTQVIKQTLDLEKVSTKERYSPMDAYRLAARVIAEYGMPITQAELNKRYKDDYNVAPYLMVSSQCGSLGALWLEFGFVHDTKAFDADDLVNIGTRQAIRTGSPKIERRLIDSLSAQKRFPSRMALRNHFDGSTTKFQEKVQQEYEEYLKLRDELGDLGVTGEVCRTVSQLRYESGQEFSSHLIDGAEILAKLSANSESAAYALRIINTGFDLLHADTMQLQLKDFKKALKKLGIQSGEEYRFVFGFIPHISYDHIKF